MDRKKFVANYVATFFFIFSLSYLKGEQSVYQSIRIFYPSISDIKIVGSIGIPLDHISGKEEYYMDIAVTSSQTSYLQEMGLDLEVLVEDMSKYFQERSLPETQRDFPLGSMQGNYTWDELNTRFDELREIYGSIISERLTLGQSVEGRDIWAFKLSDNPSIDENEPELLYTGLTHAREPLSMMNLIYFVQELCEGYNINEEMTYLINNRELWFIPVVNPDGYVYNETYQPNGGGMHRKNRLNTNCGDNTERGVDLNRNYGYGWGANNTGSSSNPCSDTYRGNSAFSEPETQIVKDFVESRSFMNVLHYHSYGNYYIHPFGSGNLPEDPDLTTFREIGNQMAKENSFVVGTGQETVGYTVNGDAVDWTYGNQGLITFTPEVGTSNDSFWPSENRVIPLCDNQVHANSVFAFISGNDIILDGVEFSERFFEPGDTVNVSIQIQNRGLLDSDGGVTLKIEQLNSLIVLPFDSISVGTLDSRASDMISLNFFISNTSDTGSKSGFIISAYDQSSFMRYDTVSFFIGYPELLFFDDFEEGLDNWQFEGDWGLSNFSYSGNWAIGNSPNGNYDNNQNTQIVLEFDSGFMFFDGLNISYKANWEIELYDDFVQFQAYVPNEGWISLHGKHTTLGSGQQGQPWKSPGYHGSSDGWVEEIILMEQLNNLIPTKFRFVFVSDTYGNADGFFVDDFGISGHPNLIPGDVNMDTFVNIFDIINLADIIQSNSYEQNLIYVQDLDRNGIVNIFDLINLINQIMGYQ